MKPQQIQIKQGMEMLASHGGLLLIGRLLKSLKLSEYLQAIPDVRCRKPDFSHADIIHTMIGLIAIGKPDFDAVEYFRRDPVFLVQALGISGCPSSPTIRQRLDLIGQNADDILKERSASLIKEMAPKLTPIKTKCGDFLPLDLDVSPFDNSNTKKEGVSWTYKKVDGYAPIFAYLGREGYLVNVELREGRQHCQSGTPNFLKKTLEAARQITDAPILLRMDFGNDSKDNNLIIHESGGIEYIGKRNLRRESAQSWAAVAKQNGCIRYETADKTSWIGMTPVGLNGERLLFPIIYEIVEIRAKKGQPLLFPELSVDTYWCSFKEIDPEEVLHLYHDHGTSEQFHSELKSDMGLERLPSQRFSTNSLILVLGMMAYNMLRILGQQSLEAMKDNDIEDLPRPRRKPVDRRRIRTVMQDLIYMAGRLIHTGRQAFISFGRINPISGLMDGILRRIEAAFLFT